MIRMVTILIVLGSVGCGHLHKDYVPFRQAADPICEAKVQELASVRNACLRESVLVNYGCPIPPAWQNGC